MLLLLAIPVCCTSLAQSVATGFKTGSLIIPMDNAKQSLNAATSFNVKAYGLVNQLLQNNIPVKWIISDGKAKDASDFSATASRLYPTTTTSSTLSFSAGPFIIDSLWAAKATPIITAYGNSVAVYRAGANFTAPVRYELTFKPKIAVFTNGNNHGVHTKALRLAGFTSPAHFDSVTTQSFTTGVACYTFASDPHWASGATAPATNHVTQFLNSGGNFFAQCVSIATYDNIQHYHTTNGIDYETNPSHQDNTNLYLSNSSPQLQFDGILINDPTGTVVNYERNGGSYQAAIEMLVYKNPTPTSGTDEGEVVSSARKTGPATVGGIVTYLGGHDYLRSSGDASEYTRATNVTWNNGLRIYYNSIFIPSTRPTSCNFVFKAEVALSSTISTTQPCVGGPVTYTVSVNNQGPGTANDVLVTTLVPAGLSYTSATASQGSYNNGTGIWTAGDISPNTTVTLSLTFNVTTSGTKTLKSYNADLIAGNVFTNDTVTQTFATETTAPSITAPSAISTTTNSGCTRTGLALGTPVTSDACGIASVTSNAPAAFPLGATTVTWTVTDNSGNTATATQTVTITDAQNPVITAPSAIATTTNSGCTRTGLALGTPTTSDNCGVASVTNNAPASFPLGSTTVIWTVTDNSGNTATASQTVTVTDAQNPVITAPSAIATTTNSGCTRTGLALGTPTTSDNCGVASVTNNAPASFPLGATTVTWTVTDNSGNTATATQTVTVTDAQNPVITAPSAISTTTNSGCTRTGLALGTPTTSDNCGVASVTNNAPASFPLGVTTVIWTVTDNSGNTATATQTVTVTDTQNPVITAPSAISTTTNSGCTRTGLALGTPTTSDNCGVASVTNNAPASFPLGSTTVIWTVTDNSGNTATASQTVTVTDAQNPVITAPSAIATTTNSGCTRTGLALGTPTTSDNCGVASVTNNAPASFPLGATTVTWTVTDNSGNTATATQTVTVTDTQNPVITAPSAISTTTNSGCTRTGLALGTPTTSDNCGVASVTNNAPAVFSLGTTTVIWTVTDNSGNTATATQTVTVTDTQNPVITAPSAISTTTNSGCTATGVSLGTPTTSDNCGVASVTNNAPASFPLGATTVTWTVTDNSGNTATASQTVTVTDAQNPVITAPSDISTATNSGCTATGISLGTPTTSDNCGVASVTNNAPASFPLGATTVVWTVTDNSGNTATATQTVTVTDTQNPLITAPSDIATTTNSGCTRTGLALATPTTSDNCGVASVTNNAPAVFPLGATTITWTVTDNSGNTATATQTVTVTDTENPTIAAPSAISTTTNSGCIRTGLVLGTPTTSDNCGVASVTNDAPASFPLGVTTVIWTVTDNSGNTSTANQSVSVTDEELPLITSPASISTVSDSGCDATNVSLGTPTTSDNCGVASVTNNAPSVFPAGTTTVTWTVTDNSGNTATATQTVTVTDTENPTITAPSSISTTTNSGCTLTGLALGIPTTSDNCGVASVINNAPAAFPLGTTTVVWTVTDNSGNTATATQTVTVTDAQNPVITAPSAIATTTNSGCTATGISLGTPTTSDNCGVASVTNDAPAVFQLGATTVTWIVTDNSGNTATATQTITVIDSENPLITAPSAIATATNSGCTATGIALGTPATSDNCGVASVTNDAPAAFPLGATIVTWTVTDNSGNTATASQTVTVTDDEAPVIVSPADIFASTNNGCTANGIILGSPVTSDNCGVASVTNDAPTIFPPGTTTVTWTVTDNSGNTAAASQVVTVTDNESPTISGCGDTLVSCDPVVIFQTPEASDNCGIAAFSQTDVTGLSSGMEFPAGNTVLEYTATDVNGNVTVCQKVIRITAVPAMADAGADKTVYIAEIIMNASSASDGIGVWALVSGNGVFGEPYEPDTRVYELAKGANVFSWTVVNEGCAGPSDLVTITYTDLNIPNGISPDNDNVNDSFTVTGLESFSSVQLTVMNRWGSTVYHSDQYLNDWKGENSQGSALADDTYYYVLDLGEGTVITGFVIISRR